MNRTRYVGNAIPGRATNFLLVALMDQSVPGHQDLRELDCDHARWTGAPPRTTRFRASPSGLTATPRALSPSGSESPIDEIGAWASVSRDGTLAYSESPLAYRRQIVVRDRAGALLRTAEGPVASPSSLAVSPEGRRLRGQYRRRCLGLRPRSRCGNPPAVPGWECGAYRSDVEHRAFVRSDRRPQLELESVGHPTRRWESGSGHGVGGDVGILFFRLVSRRSVPGTRYGRCHDWGRGRDRLPRTGRGRFLSDPVSYLSTPAWRTRRYVAQRALPRLPIQ